MQQADNHRGAEEDFVERLRPEFSDLARQLLDIAISWGRYAGFFGFDDDTDELYVEG